MKEHIIHPFEPVYNSECIMLVLGTIPSPVSREKNFYYGNPRNRFWQVLSAVFDEPVPFSIDDKINFVLRHHIALWDVLASCDIDGADDSSITHPVANDFDPLLQQTKITRIYTTGEKAYKLYTALARKKTGIPAVKLPSTSPANGAFPINTLIDYYMCLKTGVSQPVMK
ncbi:MAG: DNA-deoxyinosine glycosylase [Treponemataceae bacterium]|nr:MAG: DNA-deoxyinosine glycosylase [Treponemataceae bacterium]